LFLLAPDPSFPYGILGLPLYSETHSLPYGKQ
jgi:hypothetical protein